MPEALLNNLYIFVLAMFTGFEVITKVPPLLHTPLMSGSNAISGISVVAVSLKNAEVAGNNLILWLGVIAVAMGMINVAGGFLVTDRMLEMFKKKPAAGGKE
jgi:NAD(P) transhydrogenase subunit alpha